jgi:hypothetical protein
VNRLWIGLLVMVPFAATRVSACAVCFVDPESSMALGATWGVAVLLGVVATVLCSIVGVILFWARRARRMHAEGRLTLETGRR